MLNHEYKKGDEVELNCSEKEFLENVICGSEVLMCFVNGVAVIDSPDFGGCILVDQDKGGLCVVLHKNELKYIKPKRKTVVDSVNYLKASEDIASRMRVVCISGNNEIGFSNYIGDTDECKDICSTHDYFLCIKEMEEASWMNDNEPQCYAAHKQWWADVQEEAYTMNVAYAMNAACKAAADSFDALIESSVTNAIWKNGDECVFNGNENCFIVGDLPSSPMIVIETNELEVIAVMLGDVSKPETAEQKASREREEAAIELHSLACECLGITELVGGWNKTTDNARNGYRKMIDKGVTIK